ncbi:MAG TPA: DUF4126 domain-containing protein [Verrucomicrobiales bacterium]|nr:hypothetical protein [Pedosphaera sp.]MBL6843752.1 DUF4126 domain-containing protein [Verrucomicrobiae bacterium]RZO73128.1 MAG: DUF4126 domain-containing protein [Limisphaerales bacterium]HAO65610.1 DUF4126 domain-containing protein [Verrucomicrobiales bacterium]HAQ98863.1 DUF4126 domain-containing protein [Verrucomicrobiales bacterium]|tara:strand:+ start:69 stop:695 length:627 start_codon:yes stop_codon:yes gene_type:complete
MELIQTPSSALLSILIGLGLSASCGFRIFVPPFIISLAALSGHLELSESFAWMSTLPAVTALGAAVALEIGAYYLPVLDHFLDTVAAPAAVVAGTIVSASIFTELSPMMSWSLALIAGGGIAGAVHVAMAFIRGGSTMLTAGLGNPLVATAELGGAVGTSILSLVMPGLALVVVLTVAGVGVRQWRVKSRSKETEVSSELNVADDSIS